MHLTEMRAQSASMTTSHATLRTTLMCARREFRAHQHGICFLRCASRSDVAIAAKHPGQRCHFWRIVTAFRAIANAIPAVTAGMRDRERSI